MQVILRKKVERLGEPLTVVNVKDGFARNFLLPKKLAILATKENKKFVEAEQKRLRMHEQKRAEEAKELAQKLEGFSLTISAKASEDGKLYGSVTEAMIAEALAKEGFEVDKQAIILEEPLKKTDSYLVEVRLQPEIKAQLKVWVVAE